MKKIGVLYFDVDNLGDRVIYETATYVLERALKEIGVQDYELIPVDIGIAGRKLHVTDKYRDYVKKTEAAVAKTDSVAEQTRLYLTSWEKSPRCKYFRKHEKPKLKDLDLIVFLGGGVIKYHKQHFHYVVNEVIEYAYQNNIPVVMNSVGVEGYDENDARCQLIKKAINRDNVLGVSTRDDYETLKECYMTNVNVNITLYKKWKIIMYN